VIGHAILDAEARAVNAVPYVPPVSPGSAPYLAHQTGHPEQAGLRLRYPMQILGNEILVDSPLVGRHQLRNLALAMAAAVELQNQGESRITPETIAQGIRETRWPGRFQVIEAANGNPEYVLDVAHNPAGAWALRSTLSAAYGEAVPAREITMVFGVMRDKAVREITEILFPVAKHVIVTHANNPRSASSAEIREAAARIAAEDQIEEAGDVAAALARARTVAGAGGVVVITGSIYIVGEAMRILGVRI
jgi:dihydrofolate synthase/folylpolyglutamate synthase